MLVSESVMVCQRESKWVRVIMRDVQRNQRYICYVAQGGWVSKGFVDNIDITSNFANINDEYYSSQSFGMLHPGFDQQNCRNNERKNTKNMDFRRSLRTMEER